MLFIENAFRYLVMRLYNGRVHSGKANFPRKNWARTDKTYFQGKIEFSSTFTPFRNLGPLTTKNGPDSQSFLMRKRHGLDFCQKNFRNIFKIFQEFLNIFNPDRSTGRGIRIINCERGSKTKSQKLAMIWWKGTYIFLFYSLAVWNFCRYFHFEFEKTASFVWSKSNISLDKKRLPHQVKNQLLDQRHI